MRLIDADALVEKIRELLYPENNQLMVFNLAIRLAKIKVLEAPTIDAEPVRHGRWVQEDEDMWVCSACGNAWTFIVDGPTENGAYYCPNCGAKMDGGDPHA